MHTAIVIGGGAALLASCLLLGYAFGGRPGMVMGAQAFLPLWFILAGINLAIGVSQAGYSVAEEAPIFLAVFAGPAILAAVLWWKYS